MLLRRWNAANHRSDRRAWCFCSLPVKPLRQQTTVTRAAYVTMLEESPLLSTEFSSGEDDMPGGWQFDEDGVLSHKPHCLPRVTAPSNARPIIILPGFGNCQQDYEVPCGSTQDSLANNLRARGFQAHVLGLERKDWFRVARGLFTTRYWKGALTTDPGYTWYLQRIDKAVKSVCAQTGASKVDLVAHSAGGWLGRAYLGDPTYFSSTAPSSTQNTTASALVSLGPNPAIGSLVTLGTPQRPPPPGTVKDRTGGAQGWVHAKYPGAHFQEHGVKYVSVCGLTVSGRREIGPDGKAVYTKRRKHRPCEYAHDCYEQVCGQGQGVEGDAVVPLASAFLAGARHVMLPGVWHSMSRIGTFNEEPGVVWYGSDAVVDSWLAVYIEEAYGLKHDHLLG